LTHLPRSMPRWNRHNVGPVPLPALTSKPPTSKESGLEYISVRFPCGRSWDNWVTILYIRHNVLDVLRLRRLMLDARFLNKQPCDSVQDVRKNTSCVEWSEATTINQTLGLNSVKCNHVLVLLTGDFSRKRVFSDPLGINSARCSHHVLYSKLSGVKGSHRA
jgi:hypothetical protein